MERNLNINFHNRFDIEVRDKATGFLKETRYAENIILPRLYTRVLNFNRYTSGSYSYADYNRYIHFGSGNGTPSEANTTLFTPLGYKAADIHEQIVALPVSKVTSKIVLEANEFVGSTITEVGVSDTTSTGTVCTHAMLLDSEGNSLSVTKTDLDVIIIYASVYVTIGSSNITLTDIEGNTNYLLNYLLGYGIYTSHFNYNRYIYAGAGSAGIPKSSIRHELAQSPVVTPVIDTVNNTYTISHRFGTADANAPIRELGWLNMAKIMLPADGIYTGTALVDRLLGTGDGTSTRFEVPAPDVKNISVSIDGASSADFTIHEEPGFGYGIYPTAYSTSLTISVATADLYQHVHMSDDATLAVGRTSTGVVHLLGPMIDGFPVLDSMSFSSLTVNTAKLTKDKKYIILLGHDIINGDMPMQVYSVVDGKIGAKVDLPFTIGSSTTSVKFYDISAKYIVFGIASTLYVVQYADDTFTHVCTISTSYTLGTLIISPDETKLLGYSYYYSGLGGSRYYYSHLADIDPSTTTTRRPTSSSSGISSAVLWSDDSKKFVDFVGSSINIYKINEDNNYTKYNFQSTAAREAYWLSDTKLLVNIFTNPNNTLVILTLNHDTMEVSTKEILTITNSTYSRFAAFKPDYLLMQNGPTVSILKYDSINDTIEVIDTVTTSADTGSLDDFYQAVVIDDSKKIFLPQSNTGTGRSILLDYSSTKSYVDFSTPPAPNSVLKYSGDVDYVPKTSDHVLDVSFSIQFGEGV